MRRMFLCVLSMMFLIMAFANSGSTQCTITQASVKGSVSHSLWFGQTFTACGTGVVTSVTITPGSTHTEAAFALEAGSGIMAPTYTRTFSTSPGITQTLIIDPPFAVTNGATYSFGVKKESGSASDFFLSRKNTNPYAGGVVFKMVSETFVEVPTDDLLFEIVIEAGTVPTEQSNWGDIKTIYTD